VFKRARVMVEKETGGTQTPWEESSLNRHFPDSLHFGVNGMSIPPLMEGILPGDHTTVWI